MLYRKQGRFMGHFRPVGSGAAWRRSPHQKSAGREREKEEKEREKREGKERGEKEKKRTEEQKRKMCCGCKTPTTHLL